MMGWIQQGGVIAVLLIGAAGCSMSRYRPGRQPALTEREKAIEADLKFLSVDVGVRNTLEYEKLSRTADRIEAMISLDGVGCFKDEKGSQNYPVWIGRWLYPDRANFLMFVSNMSSGSLTDRTARTFWHQATVNCEKVVAPDFIRQTGHSDQWSFWQMGYPAVMVTDTTTYRTNTYDTPNDKMDGLDMANLGRVGEGIVAVMRDLAGAAEVDSI
jgi:hypothetical protein